MRTYAYDSNTNHFKCPACGGTWFSTTNTSLDAIKHQGHPVACKDEYGIGCEWKGRMRRPGSLNVHA